MKSKLSDFYLSLLFILMTANLFAQTDRYTLAGFVKDAVTGEALVGTNILVYNDSLNFNQPPVTGTATNKFGYYVIPSLDFKKYILIFRHLGYKTAIREISITGRNQSETFSIEMISEDIKLQEVIVEGEKQEKVLTSTIDIPPELLTNLPTLTGEVDLFKSLEMLPGVGKGSEISSGLYIRGGSPDQTLTLVDGSILYNPAHLGNIASTFNSTALSDIRLIKGAFPAEYGARLSSVLDVKLRSGSKEREKGTVGLGTINSFAAFEGPLDSNSTYLLSGRYMYYDIIQKNFDAESTTPRYNFYDVNAKVNLSVSEKSVVAISALYSKDHAYSPSSVEDTDYDIEWRNVNLSLNWLQVNTKSILLNSIISYINYNFISKIGINPASLNSYTYFSNPNLTDLYFRQNAEIRWHQDHLFKTGIDLALHNYDVLYSDVYTEALEKDPYAGTDISAVEAAWYLQAESQFGSRLSANYGGRFYYFGSTRYFNFEPRISVAYNFTSDITMKGAFAIAHQFLHLIERNDITLPTDLWYPSTKNIKPSYSTQYVLGFDTYWFDQSYAFSVEGFYKDMQSLYEFKSSIELDPVEDSIEDQFTEGKGEAYGIEFFLNKRKGNLSGWIGYTLSWSKRQFDELNGGKVFYPRYDQRHDFSIVLSYKIIDELNIGATWVYATGQRYTLPPGQYIFDPVGTGGDPQIQFNYTGINTEMFPPYTKLDVNLNYSFKWLNTNFESYLTLYNVYNRQNAFAQYVVTVENEDGEEVPVIKRISLFPFIPSAGIAVKF
ncbi:MAG: TonB-dependent receptor [Ignavibacteriaceae bacterium]|nr:TonB-dependent receptor [Ignavibacteriaceae bacterium]